MSARDVAQAAIDQLATGSAGPAGAAKASGERVTVVTREQWGAQVAHRPKEDNRRRCFARLVVGGKDDMDLNDKLNRGEIITMKPRKVRTAPPSQYPAKHKITDDTIDLALAWANREITSMQVARALGIYHGNAVYSILARSLAEHLRRTCG